MRAILFCVNPYAFGILTPLHDALINQGHDVLWYVPEKISAGFPDKNGVKKTSLIKELHDYKSDAIFVPGNEVPHYLRGVKIQVFHGLAGEKQGHFRIRNYFDLYLTQGPYFTKRFQELAARNKDFEVTETGWCKLDPLYQNHTEYLDQRKSILEQSGKKKLVIYAPTFSPSLTSASIKKNEIYELADREDIYLLIKFHDLMEPQVVHAYKKFADSRKNVEVIEDRNILKYLIMADIMISDTSSVVYEFVLLNKPVITINSNSENINWCDIKATENLLDAFRKELKEDNFKQSRLPTINQYHPYADGHSSARMIAAAENYIRKNGVPEKRNVNLYRRFLMNKMFGAIPV